MMLTASKLAVLNSVIFDGEDSNDISGDVLSTAGDEMLMQMDTMIF